MKDYNLLMEKVREYQMILNGVEEVLNNAIEKNAYITKISQEFEAEDFTQEDINLFHEIENQMNNIKYIADEGLN